jgi:hypothetical protein
VVGEGDASGDEDIEGDADKVVDVSPSLRFSLCGFKKEINLIPENKKTKQRTNI